MSHTQNKEPSQRLPRNNLPIILSMGTGRTFATVKAHCETPDAKTYGQYIQYAFEAQPVAGLLSHQELEERFNALAWSSIWKRDPGFKAWLKRQKEPLREGEVE